VELVKEMAPITGDRIAELIGVSRATIRSDLSLLVMLRVLSAKPKVGYFLGDGHEGQGTLQTDFLQGIIAQQSQGMPVVVTDSLSVQEAVITLFLENAQTLTVMMRINTSSVWRQRKIC
jgi:DNA-binding GntR family transcriptional regulator